MRALVTGGSGFIASHVVDKLLARGFCVRVFDMVYPTHRNDVEFYHGSIVEFEEVRMAMNEVDVVFHLAAVANVNDVLEEPRYAEEINVRGTMNVLEAMRRTKVDRLIYGSTTWVYSDTEGELLDEGAPLHPPTHLYTATKVASEYYCQSFAALYRLKVTILRYGIPYGPRGRAGTVIANFVDRALAGAPLLIAGDGSQYRKFVYVEDLAEGNVLALKDLAINRTYNLDGSERISIRRVAEALLTFFPDLTIEYGPERQGDFVGKEVSSERAKRELGWEAKTPFEEGLARYVEWCRERNAASASISVDFP